MNTNILQWYPFKKNADILYLTVKEEIEIEKYLSKISNKLKVIKFGNNESTIIKTFQNIEKVEGKYDKISINKKYDYIILLETLEYANEIIKSGNAYIELLKYSKEALKEDGTILLALDNRLGVRYLVGNKSEHCSNIYDSIKNKYNIGKMFSKEEIGEIIEKVGFNYRKNYYPLPNYKNANVIYTDKMLPKKEDNKINYNVVYDKDSLIVQDEIVLLKQFIGEQNFSEYTNSYLIELSNSDIDNKIKYISYNDMRKEEYSLILKMYDDRVEKHIKGSIAKKHIQEINNNNAKLRKLGFKIAEEEALQENVIESKLIEMPLLDSYIAKLIKKNDIDEAYKIIDTWYKFIGEKLKVDKNGNIKDGFIDLVFENTFYNSKDNNFVFFDQEWYMENVKIEFILYRAIQNLYMHNSMLSNYLPKEEMLSKYGIKDKNEYKDLENHLQEKVIDEEKRKFYSEQYKYIISSEEIIEIIENLKRFDKDNKELINEINKIRNMSVLDIIKDKMKR